MQWGPSNFWLQCNRCLIHVCGYYLGLPACFINPRRMRHRVTVVVVCVCYHTNCYIPRLYVENKVPLGFSWRFQDMHCVEFVENTLFKSSGNICWPPLPSSLLDELSMDKIDSDGSFSRRLVCRSSDRSYNSTYLSLVIVNYQTTAYYVISCNLHSCGYSTYEYA